MRTVRPQDLSAEQHLLKQIVQNNPDRAIREPVGPRWGKRILPAPDENPTKTQQGMRILVIASWTLGFLTLETLKKMERHHPKRFNLVGLVTDDPLDTDAKISIKKRFWRYYDEGQREAFELGILESALTFGMPCYTGEVKNDYFRDILNRLNPDVIVVSAFGQAIDRPIIEQPSMGIYNVHPSDLRHGYGAGPQPWEDMIARQASATRVTLHHVSEMIDDGAIVGQSPLINIRLADGGVSDNVRLVGEKTLLPVSRMIHQLFVQLAQNYEKGVHEPVGQIDFEGLFSPGYHEKLMQPIDPERYGHLLPLPPDDLCQGVDI